MDPNATLREIRQLIARISQDDANTPDDGTARPWNENDVRRLLELQEALDQWLTRGGFLPDAWQYKTSARVG